MSRDAKHPRVRQQELKRTASSLLLALLGRLLASLSHHRQPLQIATGLLGLASKIPLSCLLLTSLCLQLFPASSLFRKQFRPDQTSSHKTFCFAPFSAREPRSCIRILCQFGNVLRFHHLALLAVAVGVGRPNDRRWP